MENFSDYKLSPRILKALAEEGYEEPTPIQQQSIPPALDERDILGCAQTGTGKTAAFTLPILHMLATGEYSAISKRPLALVVAPTRELAIQIEESVQVYGRHLRLKSVVVYGGVGQGRQVAAISRGVHLLIATPGRLLDLVQQKEIFLNRLLTFVVDEADRMMDMGFLPDLKRIIRNLPIRRQSMFFSATMPKKIAQLAESLLHNPVQIDISPETVSLDLIDQRVIHASFAQKKPLLVKLIKAGDVGQGIVFTRTKRGANAVAEYLRRNKIDAQALHGNLSQNARQRALAAFRDDKTQILVATDLASRGIDVDGLSHVINFELPNEPEAYVHRIGRTGRAGLRGVAISLCSPEERDYLLEIERLIGFDILPDGREPEPVPERSQQKGEGGSEDGPSRNRRRRRRRGNRKGRTTGADSAPKTDAAATAADGRPTAAQRKAARNRRRRKAKKAAEE